MLRIAAGNKKESQVTKRAMIQRKLDERASKAKGKTESLEQGVASARVVGVTVTRF